jgi:hypothetical protein
MNKIKSLLSKSSSLMAVLIALAGENYEFMNDKKKTVMLKEIYY